MWDIPETVTSIKQAAELTGLKEDTIRYYERIGLLPYAERKNNGHRVYSRDHILGMIFMTRLKATGMTIEEMKHYRALTAQGSSTLAERLSILEQHKQRIQREREQLDETLRIIDYKLEHFLELSTNPDVNATDCTTSEAELQLEAKTGSRVAAKGKTVKYQAL
ncbi:MerR family transcriptional regulator [Paenibacillus rigui]|uniref:MerR family transcriptional regulator n=1 Tax=Paenibacillus rigui TaxID=554312 RepID=A0A229UN31_9BACL|nr:MerR family transcriptional regulator [Paenibacillus rigui]OXM84808.1 MerR family transcriptional regulator [Paenibacillus rigui]